ncbi:MAG: DoxX family protein [Lacunisphaera sp.]
MQKFLRLEFIPANSDLGLLVLRVVFGGSLLFLHGWGKLLNLVNDRTSFPDVIGIGHVPTLLLAIFAEVVCSTLVVVGAFTRMAAVVIGVNMSVAFFIVNSARLKGPTNGELPFLYLTAAVVLLVAGAGKYSIDKK